MATTGRTAGRWWHDGYVAMREDCKYFQRRTYRSGDAAQFCALNLAPEAPWRCPADCPRYTRRPELPAQPGGSSAEAHPGLHPDAVSILSSAEEIIGAVRPEIEAEQRRARDEEERRSQTLWNRLKRQRSRWRR